MVFITADMGTGHVVAVDSASDDLVKKVKKEAKNMFRNPVGNVVESFTLAKNQNYGLDENGYSAQFNLRAMPQKGGSSRVTRNKVKGATGNISVDNVFTKDDEHFYQAAKALGIKKGAANKYSKIAANSDKAILYNMRGNPSKIVSLSSRARKSLDAIAAEDGETARELKIMRTELTGSKSFGDSDGYKGSGFIRVMDRPHTKLFLHGGYEDFDINLDKTESVAGQDKVTTQDHNLKIGRINPEFYVRTKGEGSFLTLTAGYEGVFIKSKVGGDISYGSMSSSLDSTADGHANIFYVKPGVKIGGDKWVYIEGIVRKVDSKLGDVTGQIPQELFAGTDNSPLILGGRININDLLTFDALNLDPKKGPSSQIYVASLNNYFRAGDGRINNKVMVEFLNKYFDNEQQWRFTEMFKYETPGGKIFAVEAWYKTDGDMRAQVLIPVVKNLQLGVGAQRDHYKGFDKSKNDRIDAMLRVIF